MKFTANRMSFLQTITTAAHAIAGRTPKPILRCLRLDATASGLTVAATDLEIQIVAEEKMVEVGDSGVVLVPADQLTRIVAAMVGDAVTVATDGEMVVVSNNSSKFKIYSSPPAEYPPVSQPDGEADVTVPGKALLRLIQQGAYAVADSTTRYAFAGALLALSGGKLRCISTDGRRLAESVMEATFTDERSVIIPARTMSLISKVIGGAEDISIQFKETQVVIYTPTATLTSTVIEGQFPPYESMIQTDCDHKVTASTNDLLSAVKQAALLMTDESNGIKLAFSGSGLVLSSSAPGAGDSTVNFPCKLEGANIDIGVNPGFMADALSAADADEVIIEMSAPNRPVLFRSADYRALVMPVNLKAE